jgi:phosphotransferase system IIA component
MNTFISTRTILPTKMASDRNVSSLHHRWGIIQGECNKFTRAYDGIVCSKVSGVGVAVQVPQASDAFRAQNEGRSFNLVLWGIIQGECNKFTRAYDGIVCSKVSGVGVAVQVPQALDAFRAQNEGRSFNLVHAWLKLHKAPK